jgi:glycosyltransferase involved in cell wall biosynthesis
MNSIIDVKKLQLITGLGVGGAERVVVELTSEMIKNGYDVDVVSLNDDVSLLKQYPDINFDLSSLGMTKTINSFFKTLYRLNSIVRKNNVGLIHAHMFHSLVFSLLIKLLNPKVNVVFTSHNFGGFSSFRSSFIRITRKYRKADIIFSVNQHITLNSLNSMVIKNSVNIPNAFSVDAYNFPVNKTKFLLLGRLEKQKNPLGMIHIFSCMKNINSHLIIAGDGYLRAQIEEAILKYSLQDRVELLGVVNDVPALLASVDCLVMPSLWEGLPMVMLEAGAHSLPVVSTPVGSIPELLANDCGYLCETSEFPETLDFVADNKEMAMSYGLNLRNKIIKTYSLSNMMKQHVDVYNNALGR